MSATTAAKPVADLETIQRSFRVLYQPGDVAELRILHHPTARATTSGYYDDHELMARDAARLSGKAPAVYATLNPVLPALLARAKNHLRVVEETTKDNEILRLAWFLVDCDARRPARISATDTEHAAALEKAKQCREWLRGEGWPEPIFADSGNGGHLCYRLELANTAANTEMLKSCLLALDLYFTDTVVQVDTSTYNPSRIVKVWGTLAMKGDDVPERPHRLSRLIDDPNI
jgi:hypothetical protein